MSVIPERLPEPWFKAKVTFKNESGEVKEHIRIINKATGEIYRNESLSEISSKCFALLAGIPLYLSGYIGFHILRIPVAISYERSLWTIPYSIKAVVKAPFYALAMEFAALYGIFKPLEGRALISKIEAAWHEKSVRQEVWLDGEKSDWQLIWEGLKNTYHDQTKFAAYCMQSRGKVSVDRNSRNTKKLQLNNYH